MRRTTVPTQPLRSSPDDAALRAERRFRTLVEATALDVWRADADGRLVTDMPGWRQLTARDVVLGDAWLDDVHPDDRERVRATWASCVRSGERYVAEYRLVAADGLRTVAARAVPVRDDAGRVVEWVGVSQDVTDERRAARRAESLQRATAAFAEAVTVADVAAAVSSLAETALGTAATLVTVRDEDAAVLRLLHSTGYPDDVVAAYEEIRLDSDRVTAEVALTGQPRFFRDPQELAPDQHDEALLGRLLETGDRAWAVLPLRTTGEALGTLGMSFRSPQTFSGEEQAFLLALARQCAQALERARLFERQRTTARELQRALLPDALPQVPGLEVAVQYAPASGADVGGDWYDVLPHRDGTVALVLGDVMGRGLRAASVMGQVRNALRGIAAVDSHPAAVLRGLDAFMESFGLDEIVTLVYLRLDLTTGQVLTGNAGHLPPVVVRADGRVGSLDDGAGTPLGVPSERRSCKGTVLGPGDLLVLCSDGLVEQRDQDIDEGLGRLRAAAEAARSAADLTAAAFDVVAATGPAGDDDRTLLLARRS